MKWKCLMKAKVWMNLIMILKWLQRWATLSCCSFIFVMSFCYTEICFSFVAVYIFARNVYSNILLQSWLPLNNAVQYINLSILSIYLAWKPFQANISIFWFYWYISLKNLSKQIYWFFDFIDISCSKTFPSEYIVISIYWYILLENLSKQIYQFFDFNYISGSKTFPSKYIDFLI